jgi:hypothetical protein
MLGNKMTRRARVFLLISFGIVIGLIVAWGLPIPSQAQICRENPYTHQEECTPHHIYFVVFWQIGKFLSDSGPAITAVATVVIGYFTATIWYIARRQLRHHREVERAYVSGGGARQLNQRISDANPPDAGVNDVPVQQPDGKFIIVSPTDQFEIHINNHGKTPAHLYRIQYGFCDARNVPEEPIYEVTRKWFDNFGPGTQSRRITSIQIRNQWPNTAIFGRFFHRDIWGNRRSVGFIYEIASGPALPNDSIPVEAPRAYTQEREEPDDRTDT